MEVVGSMIQLVSAVAAAQVVNGDFASGDLAGWTSGGLGGAASVVEEGTSFSLAGSAVESWSFADPPYGARLTTSGAAGETATLAQALVVTHGRVDWAAGRESTDLALRLQLLPLLLGAPWVDASIDAPVGAVGQGTVPVDAACGETVRLLWLAGPVANPSGGAAPWLALIDAVAFGGPVCPGYADDDADGWCGAGVDLDGDGLCASVGEPTIALGTDCDDTRADLSPAAVEVVGDGVDQDCDGADDCFVDGDGDGYGGAETGPGKGLLCGDQPGEAALSLDCDDSDLAVFPGAFEGVADEVDGDCDGGEWCFADEDRDGVGGTREVVSDDVDCADPGESARSDDCDDGDPGVSPAVAEVGGDGVDQDCDGRDAAAPPLDTGDVERPPPGAPPDAGCVTGGATPSAWTGVLGLGWIAARTKRRASARVPW